jgi:hypothetical protein
MGPNACVLGWRVPHLRRWKSWGAGFPALTRWANVWRASGAPDPIRTVYSECIYLHSNHSMLSCVVIATPHARRALLYDSLPSFLPPSADTNAFLAHSCALFVQSAFFVSFVFNHLRTLVHTSFFSTPFFSTVCALFAQKQGVGGYANYSRIGTRNTSSAGMKASATGRRPHTQRRGVGHPRILRGQFVGRGNSVQKDSRRHMRRAEKDFFSVRSRRQTGRICEP